MSLVAVDEPEAPLIVDPAEDLNVVYVAVVPRAGVAVIVAVPNVGEQEQVGLAGAVVGSGG